MCKKKPLYALKSRYNVQIRDGIHKMNGKICYCAVMIALMVSTQLAAQAMPGTAREFFNRGNQFLEQGDYDKAIADFTEVIRLNPQSDSAYLNRGNAYSDNNDYDKAIADYTEAIRLNPQYADAYYSRGDAYSDKKDYNKARADYTNAMRLDPQYY